MSTPDPVAATRATQLLQAFVAAAPDAPPMLLAARAVLLTYHLGQALEMSREELRGWAFPEPVPAPKKPRARRASKASTPAVDQTPMEGPYGVALEPARGGRKPRRRPLSQTMTAQDVAELRGEA
jgi:hypothetical protein